MPIRFDRNELRKPQRHDSGFIRVDAHISRVGIQEYRLGNGQTRRELRPPEEVFDAASLESFAGVPVTLNHPPKLLSAKDAQKYSVGSVGEVVTPEDTKVRSSLAIHHADAISDVLSGRRAEVSCGYSCDLDETPGVWNGQRYDAIQRNIRGNHVALVTKGRAGPDVRIRLDAEDGEAVPHTKEEAPTMMKVRLDGVEFEAAEELAKAVTATVTKLDGLQAKFDAQAEELKATQTKLDAATDPKAVAAVVAARVQLEGSARKVLGAEAKLDGLTEKEVKLQVLAKLRPSAKFDDKSDAYVDGAFETALESKTSSVAEVRKDAAQGSDEEVEAPWLSKSDPKAARARMLERLDSLATAAK